MLIILMQERSSEDIIESLDKGLIRVAEISESGEWVVNQEAKQVILSYFQSHPSEKIQAGDLEYFDKIPLKKDFENKGIRVVSPATIRYGSYVAPGVILMPCFINIGAYVDSGTMVDTWATVGSCAQVGKNVHLSGGVGIGGVLEPLQAKPVIIEDGCFIGSRCILVEGVHIGKEAVLGANVVITGSSKIMDVSGLEPVEYVGYIPARSVVIPGAYTKKFPAGDYQVPCALIIGKRKESTDLKTSLNQALRDHNITF